MLNHWRKTLLSVIRATRSRPRIRILNYEQKENIGPATEGVIYVQAGAMLLGLPLAGEAEGPTCYRTGWTMDPHWFYTIDMPAHQGNGQHIYPVLYRTLVDQYDTASGDMITFYDPLNEAGGFVPGRLLARWSQPPPADPRQPRFTWTLAQAPYAIEWDPDLDPEPGVDWITVNLGVADYFNSIWDRLNHVTVPVVNEVTYWMPEYYRAFAYTPGVQPPNLGYTTPGGSVITVEWIGWDRIGEFEDDTIYTAQERYMLAWLQNKASDDSLYEILNRTQSIVVCPPGLNPLTG